MADEPDLDQLDLAAVRREAAARRRAQHAAEAERDQLRERVDASDRREIERLAGERFADPSDVWAITNLDAMRGDDGFLDTAKAEAEFTRIETAKPHWRKPEPTPPPPVPPTDFHNGARISAPEPQTLSFARALRDAQYG